MMLGQEQLILTNDNLDGFVTGINAPNAYNSYTLGYEIYIRINAKDDTTVFGTYKQVFKESVFTENPDSIYMVKKIW